MHTEARPYNYTQPTCVHCNTSICAVGHFLTGNFCQECKPCALKHANVVKDLQQVQTMLDAQLHPTHSASSIDNRTLIIATTAGALDGPDTCAEACVEGFYAPLGNLGMGCLRHTNLTENECGAGYWLRAGGATRDASCQLCTSCVGQNETRACGNGADSVCASCGAVLPPKAWGLSNCTAVCVPGYVRDVRTSECDSCTHVCGPGYFVPHLRDNCTHCEQCVSRMLGSVFRQNDGNFICVEECEEGYEVQYDKGQAQCVFKMSVVPLAGPPAACDCNAGTMCYFGKCESCWTVPNRDRPVADALPAQGSEIDGTWKWVVPYRECAWECTIFSNVKLLHPGGHMTCEPPSVFAIEDDGSFVHDDDTDGQRRAYEARTADHKMLAYLGTGVLGCLVAMVIVSVLVKCVLKTRRGKKKAQHVHSADANARRAQNDEVRVDV